MTPDRQPENSQDHRVLARHIKELGYELDAAKKRHRQVVQESHSAIIAAQIMRLSRNSDKRENLDPEVEERRARIEQDEQAAIAKEEEANQALGRATEAYDSAYRKYLISTVEPRVEAAKLRFEEDKLRATLSSASIVGIAATSGILLPSDPSYIAVLGW
jgi:hypothetical protein